MRVHTHTHSEVDAFTDTSIQWKTAFLEYVFCFHGFVSLYLIHFTHSQTVTERVRVDAFTDSCIHCGELPS